jgi:hypothetical protein
MIGIGGEDQIDTVVGQAHAMLIIGHSGEIAKTGLRGTLGNRLGEGL